MRSWLWKIEMNNDLIDQRLNSSWISFHDSGKIEVREAGASLVFDVEEETLFVRHVDDQPPLKWANQRRCADAAMILNKRTQLDIHIVEIKSKITLKEWVKVKSQFEGMFLNTLAVLGVIEEGLPYRIVCHISFIENAIDIDHLTDPLLIKAPVGRVQSFSDLNSWKRELMDIGNRSNVPIRKWQRSLANNSAEASFR